VPIGFPRPGLVVLQELASRVLETRALGCESETLAGDLLLGFVDACLRAGLDGVLVQLAEAYPPLDPADRFGLAEHATLRPALVAQLEHFDHNGPRNAKPRQLADALVAALGLELTDADDRTIALADEVRAEVATALGNVLEVELGVPHVRDTIVALGRARCEPRYHTAYDRIAAQLDERGMRMVRQPKVALDAVQAVQQVLADARNEVIACAAGLAIDRAREVLARANPDAAARLDQPITHRLTPRDVAIARAGEARVPKMPAAMANALFESLTELAHLAWRPLEREARPYSPKQTFSVGDLLDHPKFGRGSVVTCVAQRIEVEFPDGRHTLAHVRPGKN
jgi:hypothetical protein